MHTGERGAVPERRVLHGQSACGLPTGQTCTADAACRNGACLAGVCTTSCATDAQCPGSAWCDATTKGCLPDGRERRAARRRELHARGAVPERRVTTPTAKCGNPNGATCTGAGTCRGGSCVAVVCGAAIREQHGVHRRGRNARAASAPWTASAARRRTRRAARRAIARQRICNATGTCVAACTNGHGLRDGRVTAARAHAWRARRTARNRTARTARAAGNA